MASKPYCGSRAQHHRRDQRRRPHRRQPAARPTAGARPAPATAARRRPHHRHDGGGEQPVGSPAERHRQRRAAPAPRHQHGAAIGARDQRGPFPQHADRRRPPRTRRTASRPHRRPRSRAAPARPPRATRKRRLLAPASGMPVALSSGSASATRHDPVLRDQAAEPPLAAAVFGDRALERGAVEIRPVDRHEHEFAVGRLPQQEVGQPLLAAGADDEVGIGQIGRVEVLAEHVRR